MSKEILHLGDEFLVRHLLAFIDDRLNFAQEKRLNDGRRDGRGSANALEFALVLDGENFLVHLGVSVCGCGEREKAVPGQRNETKSVEKGEQDTENELKRQFE